MTVRVTREAEPQIELYGAYSGELLGGTQGTRSSLTFTPTDDYLIVVPKNQVNYAQLEEAPTPSSYILTTTSSATRAGETLTIPSANLPWPEPVVIGEELVTNGTFDTDTTGWTDFSVTSVWNAGRISVTYGVSASGIYQPFSTEAGKVYMAQATMVAKTGTTSVGPLLRCGNGNTPDAGLVDSAVLSNGQTATVYFVAESSTSYVYLRGGSSITVEWDNISVKEINPLAVSIQMDGRVTYADDGLDQRFFRWYQDAQNYILEYLQTESTKTGQIRFSQNNAGVFDSTATSETYLSPGVLVPFNIASRHGSTFINGAVDGTALTANTTPVALPDLSATDLELGPTFMGTLKTFRMWADDLGDTGIEEASS